MDAEERDANLRCYAANKVTWRELRERGFDDYVQVLAGLNALGLRLPVSQMDGRNRAARERGRAMIREALRTRQ